MRILKLFFVAIPFNSNGRMHGIQWKNKFSRTFDVQLEQNKPQKRLGVMFFRFRKTWRYTVKEKSTYTVMFRGIKARWNC